MIFSSDKRVGKHSLAVMFWLLTREVLRMRASISRKEPWDVAVDLFIFKTPEQAEEEIRNQREAANPDVRYVGCVRDLRVL